MAVSSAATAGPAAGQITFRASPAQPASTPSGARGGKLRDATASSSANTGSHSTQTITITNGNMSTFPLSARKAEPLDLNTVERRGTHTMAREVSRSNRLFGLEEAPTYTPTAEEFKDPMEYMRKIAPEGRKYGIAKIIPPEGWNPDFAINTERFHFRTRKQALNSVEGGTRANLNYLDQLQKFHRSRGNHLNRFPSVDKRPLDLFKLKKAVETRGGFDRVCKGKKWAEIGRDLGYSGKIMSSLSTSLKNSYQKWLHPYEEYLSIAKPGVHQMLEYENGGPFTPSPAPSPLKKSQQPTKTSSAGPDSPTARASAALNASLHDVPPLPQEQELPQPVKVSSGFTAVNSGGFTPVNAPQQTPVPQSSGFSAINAPNGIQPGQSTNSTPHRHVDSPSTLSANNTPDLRPPGLSTPMSNGQLQQLKRGLSEDAASQTNGDSDNSGRRSKRLKKDSAPTVAGSHMTQPRASAPRTGMPRDRSRDKPGDYCETCGKASDPTSILLCDSCDAGYHRYCLEPPLKSTPDYDWHCPRCLVGDGEFGFDEGGVYSLKQFQQKDQEFRAQHFRDKMQFDPVLNTKRQPSEDDVEREFWKLVENVTDKVPEVEYGADVHVTTHGSGFPTLEKNPRNPYSTDPWNLNTLPLHPESLFRHIRSDISGMTVPWLYVGMCFSTFCWHNEDHYSYSANYQHFGATKTWYGVPGEDAEKFENAMREAVPELFETQPDLLFQLVTLLTPEHLKKAGVRVYALDQRAGQFVVTFPQAYHAGFNHGFNFNEAVNFAPPDWEPWGEAGVERLQDFRRQPCFSHDELLRTAASGKDISIKVAKWLGPALERMLEKELEERTRFTTCHRSLCTAEKCAVYPVPTELPPNKQCMIFKMQDSKDMPEEDMICHFCKAFGYWSQFICQDSGKVMCIKHAGEYDCCSDRKEERVLGVEEGHVLVYRFTNDMLIELVKKVVDKARLPDEWTEELDKYLAEEPQPELKKLRKFLADGEKIPWPLAALPELKRYVDRCNEWVEKATAFTTRKQQNRRKTDRPSRKSASKHQAEQDEKERDIRTVNNLKRLLAEAEEISFDCPEISILQEHMDGISDFQKRARATLEEVRHTTVRPTQELDDLLELGRSFNLDIPEVDQLDKVLLQLKWFEEVRSYRERSQSLQDVAEFIKRGAEIGIPDGEPNMMWLKEEKSKGEVWEKTAREVMAQEMVNYQQLDALSSQAKHLPVSADTLAQVEAILKKQRDAQEQIKALYHRSKDPDFRKRPMYKEVRDAMEALNELNSKPMGTLDVEREQKRHEDWMRKGKKLFGKANAPLHILQQHMDSVCARNEACFDLNDQPRMPVEPASRHVSPASDDGGDNGAGSTRDVFCICRNPESGMMIECEVCHEWYHGKCLKIARGKLKEDDKYTCPICDYRVKIPRDATRPKLEDLEAWQDEIPNLPFQPEEEECLAKIIRTGRDFRQFISSYANPLLSNPEELTTQRFYLRKLEGADILLAQETNFFRQELHRWAPVTKEPPPKVEVSLSTRKPRPTKLQKTMAECGVDNPDDIPPEKRAKLKRGKRSSISRISGTQESHTPPGLPHGYTELPGVGVVGTTPVDHSSSRHHPSFSYPSAASHSGGGGFGASTSSAFEPGMPSFAHHRGAGSPPFHPRSPSATPANMDPAIFGSNAPFGTSDPAAPSPVRNMFNNSMGSSQGGAEGDRDLFADFTTNDADGEGMGPPPTSHAEDALNLTVEDEDEDNKDKMDFSQD
ncbi:PHD transcription factor-like protein [Phyllosticta citriasiana]|uniref:PHD transcription factor-like protein n=1 Tax=Phyllosticta citriasiana TaxID=595635 RepID=UPI0030FD7194